MMAGMPPSAMDNRRIAELDLLRGFAVLGIFVMNLMGFALPLDAYDNPAVAGGDSGWNRIAFYLQDAFFDGRMRAIFCLLFGASLAIAFDRVRAAGGDFVTLHRRNLWLVGLGVVHCVLLQMPGDILYEYGIAALLIWSFAGAPTRRLMVAGVSLLVLVSVLNVVDVNNEHHAQQALEQLQARDAAGEALSEAERTDLEAWSDSLEERGLVGVQEAAVEQVEAMRDARSWVATWRLWADDMREALTLGPSAWYFLAVPGVMLMGMALYRLGFLNGRLGSGAYVFWLVVGLAASLASHLQTRAWAAEGFSTSGLYPLDQIWYGSYETLRVLSALGWISAWLLSVRWIGMTVLHRALASTGRMALTVYLSQTVIATTLFYGWGFGLYGRFERAELLLLGLLILILQVVLANLWLSRFRQGPMEVLWRRLADGGRPFRKPAD